MYIHVYITKKTNYMYNYLLSVKKLYSISNDEHTQKNFKKYYSTSKIFYTILYIYYFCNNNSMAARYNLYQALNHGIKLLCTSFISAHIKTQDIKRCCYLQKTCLNGLSI